MDQELWRIQWTNNVTHARRASGQSVNMKHMQQRAAGGRHGRHLESMTSYQKSDSVSVDANWREEHDRSHISCRSGLKQRDGANVMLFVQSRLNSNNKNNEKSLVSVKNSQSTGPYCKHGYWRFRRLQTFQLIALHALWSALGMILSSVRPSVYLCLSVTLCIVALTVGVWGWKLFRRVPSRALPIHFFGHFCCRMYRLATKHHKSDRKQQQTSGLQLTLNK